MINTTNNEQLRETIVILSAELIELKKQLASSQKEIDLWYNDKILATQKCQALQAENDKLKTELAKLEDLLV